MGKKDYCKACKCIDPKNHGGKPKKPACKLPQYKGDGNCDDSNNNKGCGYDGGDCCPKTVNGGKVKKDYCKACKCLDPKNQGKPPASSCGSLQYKGDGNCDDDNNNKGCGYDGGDCCAKTVNGGKVKKDYCKACKCIDPDNQGKNTCGLSEYKGDGNCDDENNNKGCAYDGGDCCAGTVKGGKVQKDYCKACKCIDPKAGKKPACGSPKYKGDGVCDDDNNNKDCEYDGGDCCYKTVKGGELNLKYCEKCKCIDPENQGKNTCGLPKYKGDGNCDDKNNNEGCGYDGGDCCSSTVE